MHSNLRKEKKTVCYWHGLIDPRKLTEIYQDELLTVIQKLLTHDTKGADLDLKHVSGYKMYTARINISDRLAFTIESINGKNYILILDVIFNHDYQKSAFFQAAVLKRYLESPDKGLVQVLDESGNLIAEEAVGTLHYEGSDGPLKNDGNFEKAFYFRGKYGAFGEEQTDALAMLTERASFDKEDGFPVLVQGPPGSGKTLIATEMFCKLYQIRQEQPGAFSGPIVYVTTSPELVKEVSEEWARSIYSQNPEFNVQILTYNDLAQQVGKGMTNKTCVGFDSFESWFNRQAKKFKKEMSAQLVYNEFKIIAFCNEVQKKYTHLGIRETRLHNDAEKQSLVSELYYHYMDYLKGNQFVDTAFLQVEPNYKLGFCILDEAQDLSALALWSLFLVSDGRLLMCSDPHQALHDWVSHLNFFKQRLPFKLTTLRLEKSYRCPPAIEKFAQAILSFKSLLGAPNKDQALSDLTTLKNQYLADAQKGEQGFIAFVSSSKVEELKALTRWPNAVVIIPNNTAREEAFTLFQTPQIETIESVKGRDFDIVILYACFNRSKLKKLNDLLRATAENPSKRKDALGNEKEATLINQYYVAVTRAKQRLILCDGLDNPLLRVLKEFQVEYTSKNLDQGSEEERLRLWTEELQFIETEKRAHAEKMYGPKLHSVINPPLTSPIKSADPSLSFSNTSQSLLRKDTAKLPVQLGDNLSTSKEKDLGQAEAFFIDKENMPRNLDKLARKEKNFIALFFSPYRFKTIKMERKRKTTKNKIKIESISKKIPISLFDSIVEDNERRQILVDWVWERDKKKKDLSFFRQGLYQISSQLMNYWDSEETTALQLDTALLYLLTWSNFESYYLYAKGKDTLLDAFTEKFSDKLLPKNQSLALRLVKKSVFEMTVWLKYGDFTHLWFIPEDASNVTLFHWISSYKYGPQYFHSCIKEKPNMISQISIEHLCPLTSYYMPFTYLLSTNIGFEFLISLGHKNIKLAEDIVKNFFFEPIHSAKSIYRWHYKNVILIEWIKQLLPLISKDIHVQFFSQDIPTMIYRLAHIPNGAFFLRYFLKEHTGWLDALTLEEMLQVRSFKTADALVLPQMQSLLDPNLFSKEKYLFIEDILKKSVLIQSKFEVQQTLFYLLARSKSNLLFLDFLTDLKKDFLDLDYATFIGQDKNGASIFYEVCREHTVGRRIINKLAHKHSDYFAEFKEEDLYLNPHKEFSLFYYLTMFEEGRLFFNQLLQHNEQLRRLQLAYLYLNKQTVKVLVKRLQENPQLHFNSYIYWYFKEQSDNTIELEDEEDILACRLLYATCANLRKTFFSILELTGSKYVNHFFNSHGVTLLFLTIAYGDRDMIERVLQFGADPNLILSNMATALFAAAYHGKAEAIELLLDYGARPNVPFKTSVGEFGENIRDYFPKGREEEFEKNAGEFIAKNRSEEGIEVLPIEILNLLQYPLSNELKMRLLGPCDENKMTIVNPKISFFQNNTANWTPSIMKPSLPSL